jgi:hypothetical protein
MTPAITGATEEYDGSSWTASKFKYSKTSLAGCRNSNCSFSFWWYCPPVTGATEEYDGTTWTTSPTSLNTAR